MYKKPQLASILLKLITLTRINALLDFRRHQLAAASKSKSDILESHKPIDHSIKICGGYS